jgi:hypothetical protein
MKHSLELLNPSGLWMLSAFAALVIAGDHVAIILDTSASMSALDASGKTRMDLAKAAAAEAVQALAPGADAMVLEAARDARVASPLDRGTRRLRAAIHEVHAADVEGDLAPAVALAVDRLRQLGGSRRVMVENFGDRQRDLFVTMREQNASDVLASRRILLKPGERQPVVLTFNPASGDIGQGLILELNPKDEMPGDDVAYGRVPNGARLPVVLAAVAGSGGVPWLERALRAAPLVELLRAPGADPGAVSVPPGALVVLDGACPAQIPANDLLIGPCQRSGPIVCVGITSKGRTEHMPPAPTLMSSVDWLRRTGVKKLIGKGDKTRSPALHLIDTFVAAYEASKTPDRLESIKEVLDAWVRSKTSRRGDIQTIRDHDGAVAALKRSVDLATTLWSPVASMYPGIFVGQDTYRGNTWVPDSFPGAVTQAINDIRSGTVGANLLMAISRACSTHPTKQVVIEYGARSLAAPVDVINNESRKTVQRTGQHGEALNIQGILANVKLIATPTGVMVDGRTKTFVGGDGMGAVVMWNHEDRGLDDRPPYIGLAHELVHTLHYVTGMCYRAATGSIIDRGDSGIMEEEMRTVGFGRYGGEVPSENAIRREHTGLLERTSYGRESFERVTATAFTR